MQHKHIFAIIGESGSGKTSIVTELCKKYKMKAIQSFTTRPPRYQNEYGHIFIKDELFDALYPYMIAYTLYNGYRYGVTSEQIEDNDLYIVDWNGVESFYKDYRGDKIMIPIFIYVPQNIRSDRLTERGESIEFINQRFDNDDIMFKDVRQKCKHEIINYSIVNAVADIKTLIHKYWDGEHE